MKNSRLLKTSLGMFSLMLVTFGVGISSLPAGGNGFAITSPKNRLTVETFDPTGYEEITKAEFTSTIKDYTGTSLSRHVNVQFQSLAITAFSGRKKDVYFVVDDENYSGEKSDPFIDPEASPDKTLNGFINHAERTNSTTDKTIILSNSISYGSNFTIKATRVASGCMIAGDYGSGDKQIEKIHICEGIEYIDAGAFQNVPEGVKICCERTEAEAANYEAGWADTANIEWGVAKAKATDSAIKVSGSTKTFGEAEDFILGYQGNDKEGEEHIDAYPLTLKYQKKTVSGDLVDEYIEIPKKHLTNNYDAVGSHIYEISNNFEVSIDFEKGESIVENSLEFYNIFRAKRVYTADTGAYPLEEVKGMYTFYGIDATMDYFPSIAGDNFSHQLFEKASDQYLTVHSEFESDDEAEVMLNTYTAALEAVQDEEENKIWTKLPDDDKYQEVNHGKIYRAEVVMGEEHFALFAQAYVYDKHFISFLIIDHMVLEEKEGEGGEIIQEYVLSRNLPISKKANAIKPYYWAPDLSQGKYKCEAVAKYDRMVDIDEIFDLSYNSSSSFLGYTSISMNVTKNLVTAYAGHPIEGGKVSEDKNLALLKTEDGNYLNGTTVYKPEEVQIFGSFKAPQLYLEDSSARSKAEINLPSIVNGKISFRYVFNNINSAYLIVKYVKSGEVVSKSVKIKSANPVMEVTNNSCVLSFLVNSSDFDNIQSDDILAFGVSGMTLNIHLYNTSSKNVVQNTQYLKVFGNIEVLPYTGKKLTYFNINIYLLIFFLALTAGYAVIITALYFYRKNKYKNDEFRRMNTKAYVKTAVASYLGVILIALGINFIVLRFAVFSSSVPVFNPIDPFVIGFGIAAAISIGLFIRMLVLIVRAEKKRRETIRLNLDKDVVDDGTK